MTRRAVVAVNDHEDIAVQAARVERYLPSNYRVVDSGPEGIVIDGADEAGWTLDDYVIPRLASGLLHAEEVEAPEPIFDAAWFLNDMNKRVAQEIADAYTAGHAAGWRACEKRHKERSGS